MKNVERKEHESKKEELKRSIIEMEETGGNNEKREVMGNQRDIFYSGELTQKKNQPFIFMLSAPPFLFPAQ